MMDWLREKLAGAATWAFQAWAPEIAARLLAAIKPADVAGRIKPALRNVVAKLAPEWRPNFAKVLRLFAQVANEVATEAESLGGGR